MGSKTKYKIIPDWTVPEGKKRTDGVKMHVHPYKYIRYVHKKLGLEKAMEIAKVLVKKKYDKRFDQLSINLRTQHIS